MLTTVGSGACEGRSGMNRMLVACTMIAADPALSGFDPLLQVARLFLDEGLISQKSFDVSTLI